MLLAQTYRPIWLALLLKEQIPSRTLEYVLLAFNCCRIKTLSGCCSQSYLLYCGVLTYISKFEIQFLVCDATKFEFPPNTFDVVYSRDCIIHIPDKRDLFARFYVSSFQQS